MARINFPPNPALGDSHTVDGMVWVFNGNTWIKQLTHLPEAPANDIEYARRNNIWQAIQYPIEDDIPQVDDGTKYLRTYTTAAGEGIWEAVSGAGIAFPDVVSPIQDALYGRRNGQWDVITDADFGADAVTKNYLTNELASYSLTTHLHGINALDLDKPTNPSPAGTLLGFGAMAIEADMPDVPDIDYVRRNRDWVPLVHPNIPVYTMSKSATIISPINTDDSLLMFTPVAITVSTLNAYTESVNSQITFNVLYGLQPMDLTTGIKIMTNNYALSRDANGTHITTEITTPVIPANSWIWINIVEAELSNQKTSMFHVTMQYTEN